MRARRRVRLAVCALASAAATVVDPASAATYVDLATPFQRVADATAGAPEDERILAIRREMDALLPGVYPAGIRIDRRITKALEGFPDKESRYSEAVRAFPVGLDEALARFRAVFPGFESPLPIYLYHSLGVRDGGSAYLEPGRRHVMLFGADMIAELHADDSLVPFFDHELFHLHHGRAFSDCDQLWCGLWQEGLAVEAAAVMTPGATDHQLLLDVPGDLRSRTDASWVEALCFVSTHFDDTNPKVVEQALVGGGMPPPGLPDRFGYYVGFRLAHGTGVALPALARMDHSAARREFRRALVRALESARAACKAPPPRAEITSHDPHAV